MYVLERRALLTWSRYCGISSASRLEMATESSEGFMMHALPGSRERRRGRSPHSTSMHRLPLTYTHITNTTLLPRPN